MTRPFDETSRPDRSQAAGLLCPACRVDLVMSERQGVEIDYCPKCRGVWLDRGELDKILERGAAELAQQPRTPPPDYRRDDDRDQYQEHYRHDEYKHHKHRRRSFLDDLFD